MSYHFAQSEKTTHPAAFAAAVTPSDATVFDTATRGLFVGTAGNLSVVMAGDEATVVFPNVAAGSVLPIQVTQVLAATTASDIVRTW